MAKGENLNSLIKNIFSQNITKEEKNKALDLLSEEIEMAREILSGKFLYCPDCDDSYLLRSYLQETETEETKICIYEDPINSGGNDYVDGFLDITYRICPKGHKHEISRKERRE